MASFAIVEGGLPAGLVALPVRTRLVARGDDLVALVAEATAGIAGPGDVVAISETAVAIAQGRYIGAEYIRPSRLAYALARRAGALATVSQPESMQLVIDQVGTVRVLGAVASHVLGRLRGRRGVFYERLGEAIATIDGYTGTLPPYEQAIVFGPDDPDAFATGCAEKVGCGVAVVDVNDLRKATVLGASPGIARERLKTALLDNPHGNSDQQTPLVVFKWRGEGANPLWE
ncbi:MAG: coenzyme F420-0:L-glutamate ligase [Candidatus Eremiobacteraeota bacterium]|nr:coenzyme F420-0:L-glutamate ligase [Candidatus Eremiobacteraeota bacterium]